MQSRCQSSRVDVPFYRPLPVFRVVRCLSANCFQTRITVELSAAHELLLRDRKILLLEGFSRSNFVFGISPYFVVEAYLEASQQKKPSVNIKSGSPVWEDKFIDFRKYETSFVIMPPHTFTSGSPQRSLSLILAGCPYLPPYQLTLQSLLRLK
ncbi:hypothetical protein TNCV_3614161 [Trichonephila clavipes]|uniref:Uncharacterized protein n=1 Tax=Trichonephila clavipes TaxID=2585209 RepID=A0A8X6VDC2_TRICX|nr:hypothetical protein TNCV_3614161 [Trichonephila clavipes]